MKSPTRIGLMVAAVCATLGTSMYALAQSAPVTPQPGQGYGAQQGGPGMMQGRGGMQRGAHKGSRGGRGGQGGQGMAMLDTDKDGAISKAEHDKHFETLDTDRDGKISATEQQAARDKMRAGMRQARADRGQGTCRADGNGDGVVTRAEAEKFGPRMLPRFDAADTNRDGKLDATELKAQCPVRAAL